MARIRFFGLIREIIKKNNMEIEAENIEEALTLIAKNSNDIKIKDLKKCLIFVNGVNIIELNKFKTKISKDDEIHILSPVAGG